MANRKFWLDFENFIGFKLPKDIPNILTECGYDSELAIISLTEKDLETIESVIDKKKHILKYSRNYKEYYDSHERFVLKPGHKSLILGLRKKIEEFVKTKKDDAETKNKNETLDGNELKTGLIEKLKRYMLRFSFNINFTESDISDFTFVQHENCYKCGVKCPFCMKVYSCKYLTHWIVSNYETHIKAHVDDAKSLNII